MKKSGIPLHLIPAPPYQMEKFRFIRGLYTVGPFAGLADYYVATVLDVWEDEVRLIAGYFQIVEFIEKRMKWEDFTASIALIRGTSRPPLPREVPSNDYE